MPGEHDPFGAGPRLDRGIAQNGAGGIFACADGGGSEWRTSANAAVILRLECVSWSADNAPLPRQLRQGLCCPRAFWGSAVGLYGSEGGAGRRHAP